jgi:phage shock protein A
MGFFSRILRIFRGRANDAVESMEARNFDTVVKQNIREMREELNKVIRASADAISNYNRLETEYEKYRRQSDEWKEKAKKALMAGNEELAKKALAKKAEADRQVAAMEQAVQQARTIRDRLKEQVESYKWKIDEAERNARTLVARKNAASAQKKVAKVLAGVNESDNAFATLARFEDTVAREEATATAYEELGTDASADLDKEFAALDTSSTDTDLEALKAEMGLSKVAEDARKRL